MSVSNTGERKDMASANQYDIEPVIEDHPTLGAYISHHPSRRGMLIIRAAIAYFVPVMLLNILFLNDESSLVRIGLPMLFAVIALGAMWYVAHLWNREVILYQHGFTYREGSREAPFFYGEVASLQPRITRESYAGIIKRTLYQYNITTKDDQHLTINNLYSDIDKLSDRLERFIIRDQLADVQLRFEKDQRIRFGDQLHLSKMGIEYAGRDLFWHDFAGYKTNDGALTLQATQEPEWARIPLADLDNLLLLVTVLKSQRSVRTDTTANS